MMTVGQLIERLSELNSDLPVSIGSAQFDRSPKMRREIGGVCLGRRGTADDWTHVTIESEDWMEAVRQLSGYS